MQRPSPPVYPKVVGSRNGRRAGVPPALDLCQTGPCGIGTTFTKAGMVGLWTKADSVTLFDEMNYGATK